jgi:hypothetical protein
MTDNWLNSFSGRFPKTNICLILLFGTVFFVGGFVFVLAWQGSINFWAFLKETCSDMRFFTDETLVFGWKLNLKELRNLNNRVGSEK